MRTGGGRTLAVALVLGVLLTGCASTVASQYSIGLPNAQNPEYLAHPFRLAALGAHMAGNAIQLGIVEPFYFFMNRIPDAVGLSLDEQRLIEQRQADWEKSLSSQ
jgi:hypothetical protein